MPRAEPAVPVRMRRVAIVAPEKALRASLVRIAEAGCVEIDLPGGEGGKAGAAAMCLRRMRTEPAPPALSENPPDLAALERAGRTDLLAGEAELEERLGSAVRRGEVAALAGWCPASQVGATAARVAGAGGTLLPLRAPRGVDPPTLLTGADAAAAPARPAKAVRRSFTPLVSTYGTVPYADLDPTVPAGIVYVVMFGLMFGDAGHGLLVVVIALLLRARRPRRFAALRPLWPFVAGAGLAATLTGVAYGEFFGPTGVLPVLWLQPLQQPMRLLTAAVGLGAVLLAAAYAAGVANRWREGGPAAALYSTTGIAGAALYVGLGALAAYVWLGQAAYAVAGAAVAAAGLVLAGAGLHATTPGGPAAAMQTGIQLFDAVVRIGSNVVSFARLAAFGLTHAVLGAIVWNGTTALAGRGPAGVAGAAVMFVAGNALAFSLEALVAGVQALRLEFYELFSRLFEGEGRPFRPWHVPVLRPAGTAPGAELSAAGEAARHVPARKEEP